MKIIICLSFLFLSLLSYAQNNTVSGFVYDSQNHERLISASLNVIGSYSGCISNEQGYYSLSMRKGPVLLKVSFVGYAPDTFRLNVKGDTVLTCYLKPNNTINEISVIGKSYPVSYNATKVLASEMAKLPVLAGEPDIMKTLQLLPGIQSTSEGQAGFSVKGGDDSQNLILLDGVPVYNMNHLFGFFSIFNEKSIQDITLYKGDFPAQYGGRLSSVVDIQTKEGNANHYAGSASVGLLASSVNIEGPVLNDKTTFFISGRRSYIDFLAAPIIKYYSGYDAATYGFYDFNTKITHRFRNNDKLIFSLYRSHDSGNTSSSDETNYFSEQQGVAWGNTLASLTLNHVVSSTIFLNTIVHYSKYDYSSTDTYAQNYKTDYSTTQNNYQSTIYDEGVKTNLTWFQSAAFTLRAGAEYTLQKFVPGVESSYSSNVTPTGEPIHTENTVGNKLSRSNQFNLYAEGDFRPFRAFALHAGIRYTGYKNISLFNNLEPRLNLEYFLGKGKLSLSYCMAHQFTHLLTTSQISQGTDLWVPSTTGILPERSVQYSLNMEHPVGLGYIARAELYYKTFHNLLAYQDGASYLTSSSWQDMVTRGEGTSRGLSLTLEKKTGRTTGWITYTLSKTERRFGLINDGQSFPFDYDHRHDLKIVVMHRFSSHFDAGCTWIYHSGNFISFGNIMDEHGFVYIKRNAYEMPDYQRLDIDLNYHIKTRKLEHIITLGVYNTYNHKNIYNIELFNNGIFYSSNVDLNSHSYFVKEKTLFPIIPSLTYRINIQ